MIEARDLLIVFGFTAFVVLMLGPAMWSSDTEFLVVRIWRRLRGRKAAAGEKTPPDDKSGKPPANTASG